MKRHVSRLFAILLSVLSVCSILIPVSAVSIEHGGEQKLDFYHEISEVSYEESSLGTEYAGFKTKTAKITDKLYSKDGTLLWTVTLHATFKFDGFTYGECVKAWDDVIISGSRWSEKSRTVTKKATTAYSVVVFNYKNAGVNMSGERTTSRLKLVCSPDGTVRKG